MKQVTIQGEPGCFHEEAARRYFGDEPIEIVPCRTFEAQFERMRHEGSLLGIVAIENTIAGSLLQNHELLRRSESQIIGECKLRISHVLAALPGQRLDELSEVNSPPDRPDAVRRIPQSPPAAQSRRAGRYGGQRRRDRRTPSHGTRRHLRPAGGRTLRIEILEEGIETNKRNFTRFLLLADRYHADRHTGSARADKASLVFSLPHTQGSLSKVLTILSFYDINLTKIQSMPIIGCEWEYRFYVDVSFADYTRYRQSIDAITPLTKDFKILGEYAAFNE